MTSLRLNRTTKENVGEAAIRVELAEGRDCRSWPAGVGQEQSRCVVETKERWNPAKGKITPGYLQIESVDNRNS